MKIEEIAPGTPITIRVEKGGNSAEFTTIAEMPIKDTLIVKEIQTFDGKPISLFNDTLFITAISINERNLPVMWKGVTIKHIKLNGVNYHRIAQSEDGKTTNRRGAYRLYVGLSATLQKGMNKAVIDVVMKDVSVNGFSFVTTDEIDIGELVHIVCATNSSYTINTWGTVVRIQKVENSQKIIYGCKIKAFSKELDKFITASQRELLRKGRN